MNKFLVIGFVLTFIGCSRPTSVYDRAEHEMRRNATNDIIGFARFIEGISATYIDFSDGSTTNWRGHVTAEFINPLGGITRTNLVYSFIPFTNDGRLDILARIDPAWEYQQATEKFNAAMRAARGEKQP